MTWCEEPQWCPTRRMAHPPQQRQQQPQQRHIQRPQPQPHGQDPLAVAPVPTRRRREGPPPATESDPRVVGRRLYAHTDITCASSPQSDADSLMQCAGKRYIPPRDAHLSHNAQVVSEGAEKCLRERRHCTEMAHSREQSRERGLAVQKRHIQKEDHMRGASVDGPCRGGEAWARSADGIGAELRHRSARRSSSQPSTGVANALRDHRTWAGPAPRPRTPGRRHIEPEGALFGGTLRGAPVATAQPEFVEASSPMRSARASGPSAPQDNLQNGTWIRGSQNCGGPPAVAMASPRRRLSYSGPQDSLFGSGFRNSAPVVPVASSGCEAKASACRPKSPVMAKSAQVQTAQAQSARRGLVG